MRSPSGDAGIWKARSAIAFHPVLTALLKSPVGTVAPPAIPKCVTGYTAWAFAAWTPTPSVRASAAAVDSKYFIPTPPHHLCMGRRLVRDSWNGSAMPHRKEHEPCPASCVHGRRPPRQNETTPLE